MGPYLFPGTSYGPRIELVRLDRVCNRYMLGIQEPRDSGSIVSTLDEHLELLDPEWPSPAP